MASSDDHDYLFKSEFWRFSDTAAQHRGAEFLCLVSETHLSGGVKSIQLCIFVGLAVLRLVLASVRNFTEAR